jgi:Uma2 family endonuclease
VAGEQAATMAISPVPTQTYTPEQYLALEVKAETRSEYRHGTIIQMTGGTPGTTSPQPTD